jgi:hypothetical protein
MADKSGPDFPGPVREKYGAIAKSVASGGRRQSSCESSLRDEVPPDVRRNMELWTGCLAEKEYKPKFAACCCDPGCCG